mmetsp:Transcript_20744/g.53891  ORF Transcript_20744/g.53891 Transcript_20744/m.53891 type:complete len:281 (+) Transcript_20744:2306-3148(+)
MRRCCHVPTVGMATDAVTEVIHSRPLRLGACRGGEARHPGRVWLAHSPPGLRARGQARCQRDVALEASKIVDIRPADEHFRSNSVHFARVNGTLLHRREEGKCRRAVRRDAPFRELVSDEAGRAHPRLVHLSHVGKRRRKATTRLATHVARGVRVRHRASSADGALRVELGLCDEVGGVVEERHGLGTLASVALGAQDCKVGHLGCASHVLGLEARGHLLHICRFLGSQEGHHGRGGTIELRTAKLGVRDEAVPAIASARDHVVIPRVGKRAEVPPLDVL